MENLRVDTDTIMQNKFSMDSARLASHGDLNRVLGVVSNLQSNLNMVKELITSNTSSSAEIKALSVSSAKLAEDNISLRDICTEISKFLILIPESRLLTLQSRGDC